MMVTTSSLQNETPCRDFVVRTPIRLYESSGTIFELYDGGRPYEHMAIRWNALSRLREWNRNRQNFTAGWRISDEQ